MSQPRAYYNEHDEFAAAWLRELIAAGEIAPGDVDTRSIEDVRPDDLKGYTQCHFFAGIGVWSYALRRAGWRDEWPIWTGSCPCQPFSAAGKGQGFADERHLWPTWQWLIGQCNPAIVLGEQVASKDGLAWLDTVCADMEGAGYAIGATDLCAAGVGAPHIRQRLWFVAKRLADSDGWFSGDGHVQPSRQHRQQPENGRSGELDNRARPSPTNGFWRNADWLYCRDGKWRPVGPGTFPLADGPNARVGRLRCYGNAIVAPAAQAFIEAALTEEIAQDNGEVPVQLEVDLFS